MKSEPHLPAEQVMDVKRCQLCSVIDLRLLITLPWVHSPYRVQNLEKVVRSGGLLECISGLLPHNLIQMWQNRQL